MQEETRPAASASLSERVASFIERRSGLVVGMVVLLTGLLAIPFLTMAPEDAASQDPRGEVLDAQEFINDRFASSVFGATYVVEARDGNVLTRDSMLELLENSAELRADPQVGPKLLSHYDSELGVDREGVYSIADSADALLRVRGVEGLAAADDEQVSAAVATLLQRHSASDWGLSIEADRDSATGRWTSPAMFVSVLADNVALGGGGQEVRLGGDTDKEEFARDMQSLLRGSETHNQVWGVAIDVNLTSGEQGATAGPFIGFTILAVLVVLGIVFRSYWAVAITGGALAALMVWLKGFSNLIGLKSDLTLDLIVPIAMISFGIDFAFHAIGRLARPGFDGGSVSWRIVSSEKGDRVSWPDHRSTHRSSGSAVCASPASRSVRSPRSRVTSASTTRPCASGCARTRPTTVPAPTG